MLDDSRKRLNHRAKPMTIQKQFPVFELDLKESEVNTVYLRLVPMGIPVSIYVASVGHFQTHDARFRLIFGIMVGVMLFISVYKFFLYFTTRDQLRLLYSLSVVVFAIYTAARRNCSLY
jgi:hypothetical protein